MTHEELLAKVEKQTIHIANKIRPVANDCEKEIGGFANALRAVVELHKPANLLDIGGVDRVICTICGWRGIELYPCPTIQAIEKELA